MKKQILLSIPKPCHENWDQMNPVEKGRFCGSCQKQVVDFSRMSDREIAVFFKKPATGSVCGRFMQDQLERPVEIPKKRIPWLKYFFQIALPAFLFSMKTTAQGKVKTTTVQNISLRGTCTATLGMTAPIIIRQGDIASRIIESPKSKLEDTLTLPEVIIHSTFPQRVLGEISVVGNKTIVDVCKQEQAVDSGLTIIAGGISVTRITDEKNLTDTLINKITDDLISPPAIRVFPNPIHPGTSLKIEFMKAEEGKYHLQLLAESGQTILQSEFYLGEERLYEFQMPFLLPGSYFLTVTNKRSGKSYTGKLLVE